MVSWECGVEVFSSPWMAWKSREHVKFFDNEFTSTEMIFRAPGNLLESSPDLECSEEALKQRLDAAQYDALPVGTQLRQAAVLVPVRDDDHASVILTKRSDAMPSHAGQISFPGGQISGPHETPLQAALREAEEEIGLSQDQVQVLGFLDAYMTGTGYIIAPVVGIVDRYFVPEIEEREVASVFDVPLSFLMDPLNYGIHERYITGKFRKYYAITYKEHFIWGATAGMLKNLYDRIYA